MDDLTQAERSFAERAVRRARLFLALSIASVLVGLALAAHTLVRRLDDPSYPIGARSVIVILVLLGGRQNLRQYRYARVLKAMMRAEGRHDAA